MTMELTQHACVRVCVVYYVYENVCVCMCVCVCVCACILYKWVSIRAEILRPYDPWLPPVHVQPT